MPGARLDLAAIETALQGRVAAARPGSGGLSDDLFTADVARRMVEGYREVDRFLAEGCDPLAFGQSHRLLELNHMVLCGRSPQRRAEHAAHIAATEARFYGDPESGADGFYDWLGRLGRMPARDLAARIYVRVVSSPQLFIEGNQRTATLCASHVLAKAGLPPIVLDAALVPRFAPVAAACRRVDRGGVLSGLRLWMAAHRLRQILEQTEGAQYLRPSATAATGPVPGGESEAVAQGCSARRQP